MLRSGIAALRLESPMTVFGVPHGQTGARRVAQGQRGCLGDRRRSLLQLFPVHSIRRGPRRAAAGVVSAGFAPSPVPALQAQQRTWLHSLPSGKRLEVIEKLADASSGLPPIVFIHGSYHAAWCFAEKWLPYFQQRGHSCYALSMLGQGGSDLPDGPVAGTLQSLARDVAHFIRSSVGAPPVLLGHSFGGLIVQAYLAGPEGARKGEEEGQPGDSLSRAEAAAESFPGLAAAVLACSVPPTGNAGLIRRFLKTKPLASIKVTLSLAARAFVWWRWLCRESFFSPSMPEEEVQRYQGLLGSSSRVPLFDLAALNASLPVEKPPALQAPPIPILVIGAAEDFLLVWGGRGLQQQALMPLHVGHVFLHE
eukprot:TRINITY_DN4330_c0_g1_i3.p1 TRINITY_DN4330_c0_g1~~TRINITY_DN4330_c0_g1_i3.p1  ORF type:complete len:366 (+),score=84.41 TRINITY_DN4330_c0_g1_i3:83-1180(+)